MAPLKLDFHHQEDTSDYLPARGEARMRKSYDFTILNSEGWIIFCAGRRNGPYETRMMAVMVAKTAAMKAVAAGCKAKVVERSHSGEVRTLWSQDPLDDCIALLAAGD